MNPEIEKLISLAVVTGEISEKNRATIMRKAESLGENLDEVEMILNGELSLLKKTSINNNQSQSPTKIKNNEEENINFILAAKIFINNHKMLKYASIFFLICLSFFLLSLLFTLLI